MQALVWRGTHLAQRLRWELQGVRSKRIYIGVMGKELERSPFSKGCAFPFELEELQITVCLRRCGSYGSFSSKIREVEQTGSDYRWMKSDHTEGRQ